MIATIQDAEFITELYNFSIQNDKFSNCNLKLIDISTWEQKITDPSNIILVDRAEEGINGFAMVQPISIRSNYKNVWELSIYINKNKRNNQIALNLYRDILQQMPKQKAQYLCALVFENNTRSMELLQYSGFRTFIELKEAAEMADQEFYQMNLLMNKLN